MHIQHIHTTNRQDYLTRLNEKCVYDWALGKWYNRNIHVRSSNSGAVVVVAVLSSWSPLLLLLSTQFCFYFILFDSLARSLYLCFWILLFFYYYYYYSYVCSIWSLLRSHFSVWDVSLDNSLASLLEVEFFFLVCVYTHTHTFSLCHTISHFICFFIRFVCVFFFIYLFILCHLRCLYSILLLFVI